MESIIEIKNISVKFGDRAVLENVSFNVKRGERLFIVGGSGCGKSTMLRSLIGIQSVSTGEVLIDGIDIHNSKSDEKLKALNKIGMLFQSGGLLASMSLAENVALPIKSYTKLSKEEVERLVDLKLGIVGLDGFQDFLPSEISGGMKKRAGLARAMALDPDILCFDEPSAGLDPVISASLDDLIIDLNETLGATIIVVSHELQSIEKTAQRVIMFDRNTKGIIADGTVNELKKSKIPKVYNFFNRIASEDN